MLKLTDEQLLEELQKRFDESKSIISRTGALMIQLELMNKKLVESEKLKSNFLSNIRNEINNPLAVVLGQAANILNIKDANPDVIKNMVKTIYAEAFNLNFQFNNIFHAADIEAGELVLNISKIDLHKFMQNLIVMFEQRLNEKNIMLDVQNATVKSHATMIFHSDADKLSIIISNLLDNAIKFSNSGGTVVFKYFLENTVLHFYIIDNGKGIAKNDQDRIFDRFCQLDSGATKLHKGHGLGLAVTKALLEFLNGAVEVNSLEGAGSEFIVTIPESTNPCFDMADSTSGNELIFTEGEVF
ncbi:MAG TPA: HAMP domain-containing sensor histidine kinase [bacterium]|nr:HAMP domain-containing sensor histidine kinase [bacterium]HPN43966.1 HAMP domain-containing sensor histidine kinase [bacterium]